MQDFNKLKEKALKKFTDNIARAFLFDPPKDQTEPGPKFRREPVSEAFIEFNEQTGKWIVYGGSGHGAWGGELTEEEVKGLIESGEFKLLT